MGGIRGVPPFWTGPFQKLMIFFLENEAAHRGWVVGLFPFEWICQIWPDKYVDERMYIGIGNLFETPIFYLLRDHYRLPLHEQIAMESMRVFSSEFNT